ncbi:hypothetical protein MXD63_14005 [Frankia sp. Cpl3]|uniref:hypothetical protein n=1 Tax=Parafrankia colletiae TaxID=573497 RepID=UPI000AE49497|nr:hypothetical protein [Parafrankia colletiae]MCK9901189.1 hypothetical protein [Frankia sp. Cpl3]
MPTRWSRWRYRALSALLGAVPAVAFPALSACPVGFLGVVPATLVIVAAAVPREAAIRAWCGGTGFFLATCYWLVPNTGPYIVVLGLAPGVTWMPWGVLVWTAPRPRLPSQPPGYRRLAWALGAVPSGWVIGEFARSREGFGGPWALLGASQWNARPFLPLAAVGGVWLLSFLLAAVNLLVAAAVMPGLQPGRRRPWRAGVALVAGLLVAVMAAVPTPANTGTLTVGGVQPGVVHGADVRFADGEAATRSLVGAGVDLVVWGESSVGCHGAAGGPSAPRQALHDGVIRGGRAGLSAPTRLYGRSWLRRAVRSGATGRRRMISAISRFGPSCTRDCLGTTQLWQRRPRS